MAGTLTASPCARQIRAHRGLAALAVLNDNVAMHTPPAGFNELVPALLAEAKTVEGYLSEKDIRFLALLAACPTTAGEILEIGSFKGKSTIILAKAAALAGRPRVVAIDPFVHPGLAGGNASRQQLDQNLQGHGVAEQVEFHQEYSALVAKTWTRPLRLLWIDGDHSYQGAKSDFDCFARFLADGAIVAMHDVLHAEEGPIRVILEDVLLSRHFGPAGVCGSIGWAQFFADPERAAQYRDARLALYRRLSRLVPYVAFDQKPKGVVKVAYKLLRSRVPHDAVDPTRWLAQVRPAA
jgi:predicted O-methyltransferase YrrM